MSARDTASRVGMLLLSLVLLPGRIVEEGLHAIGSWPWARWIRVDIDPEAGSASTRVAFRDSTPDWAITLAYALPEIVGWSAGVLVLGWWVLVGPVWWPATTLDWVLLSLLGAQWLAVALPSAADRDRTATDTAARGGPQR